MRKLSSGKCSGIKRPSKLEEIWRISTRLEIENDLMQLALLNLAIDSELRASDLLKLHVYDVSSQGVIYERVQCIQQKLASMSTIRLLRERSKVFAGGFFLHP